VWRKPWATGGNLSPSSARICRQHPHGKVRPCDIYKLLNLLKLSKACRLDSIPNKCHGHLPSRPLVYLRHLFNHYLRLRLSHFPKAWEEAKVITLPKPCKDPISLKIYVRLVSHPQQEIYSRKLFWKYSKDTLKKKACLMQCSFVFVPVATRHFNVWGLRTTSP
jgi:hypothetical protein